MTDDPSVTAALRDLVADGTLTDQQAARVAQRLQASRRAAAPDDAARRTRLAEVAGYLGAALLLGAAALFLATEWADLGENGRVGVLAAVALVLLVVGGVLAATAPGSLTTLRRTEHSARRRVVSSTWTVAAAAAGMATGLWADSSEVAVGAGLGVAVAAGTYVLVPGLVGQLGLWAGTVIFVNAAVDTIGDNPDLAAFVLADVGLGIGWIAAGAAGLLVDREVAVALGLAMVLFVGQVPVLADEAEPLGYAITAALAVGGFVGFLALRSWSVLAAGVLATTLVVPEVLHDWTDGSLSAAGALLVAGVTLLLASAAGLRLRRVA